MAIFQAMGWLAPAIIMVAQGERSMCNHDEDALTMAVAAARDCLAGKDKSLVDTSYLCSTTLPFADRQNAGILSTALNLKSDLMTADFTSSLRAGTTGPFSGGGVLGRGRPSSVGSTGGSNCAWAGPAKTAHSAAQRSARSARRAMGSNSNDSTLTDRQSTHCTPCLARLYARRRISARDAAA